MIEVAEMRYKGDLTAGALKVAESRIIASLLLRKVDDEGWKDAIVKRNVLQARSPATATRLTKLVKGRLLTMGPDLWRLVRDGKGSVATAWRCRGRPGTSSPGRESGRPGRNAAPRRHGGLRRLPNTPFPTLKPENRPGSI